MTFFESVRASFGPLKQSQVDGFNVLLTATAGLPIAWRAYILATAFHEVARTMQPIIERGARKYFDMYEPPSKKAKALGNTLKGDGYKYRGRGYVQITGRSNYHKASAVTGVDLVANPDRALEAGIAAKIIVDGMTRGWFTGKKLGDYPQGDFKNYRRIVNGTDKASDIAEYAILFEAALAKMPAKAPEKLTQPVPHIPAPMAPKVVQPQPTAPGPNVFPPPVPPRPWWKFWA
ncbi:MAG: hypothetical protein Q8L53_16655 [Aestuariivirga sp.]|nr:hypothetical protein [Aestuariivirga sp.]